MSNWIESDRLILRPFRLNEWRNVLKYTSKPEVWKYIAAEPQTEKDARQFIAYIVEQQVQRNGFGDNIAIILKPNYEIIGHMIMQWIYYPNHIMKAAVIIDPQFQSKGYGTEAFRSALNYAFTKTVAHRIMSSCDSRNKAAVKLMENAGMKLEGNLRESIFIDDNWQDELYFAALKKDWNF